jgi:hypothetical protein
MPARPIILSVQSADGKATMIRLHVYTDEKQETTTSLTQAEKNLRRSVWNAARAQPLVWRLAPFVLHLDVVRHDDMSKHRLEFCRSKPSPRATEQGFL